MRHRALVSFLLAACASAGSQPGGTPAPVHGSVVLVSIDGLRYDYLDRYPSPNLHRIIAAGVRVPLVPVFPSKTFPNHYSIVTGLFPEHHGVVDNTMYDPVFDALFKITDSAAVGDARWWGGEPLWVTAQRQGQLAGALFWPGTEAAIDGVRPRYWTRYDSRISSSARVRQVLDWLTLPMAARPTFITVYFSQVDHEGHDSGPDGPNVAAALLQVDSAIGQLLDGLESRGLDSTVNVIIVSDHGMARTSLDSVIVLEDYGIGDQVERFTGSSAATGIWPRTGMLDSVYLRLHGKHPHLSVWKRADIPERFHYRDNRRVPPVMALADIGWSIATTRRELSQHPGWFRGGTHGYDDTLSAMRATFLAEGPAFKHGFVGSAIRNIHLYDMMAGILGLTPALNDGSTDSTVMLLR